MRRYALRLLALIALFTLLTRVMPPAGQAPAAQPAATDGKLVVFGAFATAIEEPWDGVIHTALQKSQEEGQITYSYTDDIGYAGDMERVLREVAEENKPAIIFGDAFGNEEAVRRVAADYPGNRLCLWLRRRSGRAELRLDTGITNRPTSPACWLAG